MNSFGKIILLKEFYFKAILSYDLRYPNFTTYYAEIDSILNHFDLLTILKSNVNERRLTTLPEHN